MPNNVNYSWMLDSQSDESDPPSVKQSVPQTKTKYSHMSNSITSDFAKENCTSSDESTEFNEDDDADDEDWVASDIEKKRTSRGNKLHPSYRQASHQRDRSRTKHHHNSPRLSNQSASGSAQQNRTNSQTQRTLHRSAYHRNQPQTSVPTTRRNHSKSGAHDIPAKVSLPIELTKLRQCFGPGCTRIAVRPDTKFCSDECGIKLAIRRFEVLLPQRLNGIRFSVAEQLYKKRLNEIQREKCSVHDRLLKLEMDHQQLTSLIARARDSVSDLVDESALDDAAREAEQFEQMEPVVCVTCASEVSMRHALRHMEKCFQKMEGSTVFCASQKEQIMGTPLFCDTYDNQAKAYCKRLRVVCEHFKEPKLAPDTICGFPLVRQVFVETGEFCHVLRNRCSRHLGWERLRRANIDIERYRCLIRMDELLQEEQRVRQSLSQRGGILGLMLHQTIDHNPSVPAPMPSELKNVVLDTGNTDTDESLHFCSS